MPEHEALWTTDQVAEFLNVKPKTVRRWQAQHIIPFVKIGGSVRYLPADVRAWVESRKATPAGEADRHLQRLGL